MNVYVSQFQYSILTFLKFWRKIKLLNCFIPHKSNAFFLFKKKAKVWNFTSGHFYRSSLFSFECAIFSCLSTFLKLLWNPKGKWPKSNSHIEIWILPRVFHSGTDWGDLRGLREPAMCSAATAFAQFQRATHSFLVDIFSLTNFMPFFLQRLANANSAKTTHKLPWINFMLKLMSLRFWTFILSTYSVYVADELTCPL